MLKYANQPNLPPLLKDFVNHELAIRNRSELTVDEYALDLILFFRFLKQYRNLVPPTLAFEDIDISDIDIAFLRTVSLADAYAFLSYCKSERDNDAAARARKSSSIRAFFRYISVQQKLLDENPMQELETPKQKKAQRHIGGADGNLSPLQIPDLQQSFFPGFELFISFFHKRK